MISKKIYKEAESLGACSWGLEGIKNASSIQDLIRLLKTPKGLEFVLENDSFLSIELLEKYRDLLESENVFFDGIHKVENPKVLVVLGGHVEVEANGFSCCRIYSKGSVRLFAYENAFVLTSIHCDGLVFSEVHGQAKVKEY